MSCLLSMWTCLYYVLLFKRASWFVHTVYYYGKSLRHYVKTRCYLVESICCLVQLRGVVPENLRMRHCVDKTVWHNNMSSSQVTLRQDDPNFNIMTYTFDIIKHRVDKATPYVDKITCLCKIITHYIDKFTCFLDKITPRCDKIKWFFNIIRQWVGMSTLYIDKTTRVFKITT